MIGWLRRRRPVPRSLAEIAAVAEALRALVEHGRRNPHQAEALRVVALAVTREHLHGQPTVAADNVTPIKRKDYSR